MRGFAAGLALALLAVAPAHAQQDTRSIRVVVPAPPGGSLDATARMIAQRLTAVTGEAHVVDNRPGANSMIGVEHVARAQPDGRTLLFAGTSLVTNALVQKLSYVPLEDVRPIMGIASERYVLIAAAHVNATSASQLKAIAAARPGGLNCAAPPGPAGLACAQLKARLNGAMVSVPYPGTAPAMAAIAGGHVDVMFAPLELSAKLIDGKLAQMLAISRRNAGDAVPTLSEVWPGFVLEGMVAVYLPAGVPEARLRQLHRELTQVMSEPETLRRLQITGMDPLPPATPESFARLMRAMFNRYEQMARDIGLPPP